MNKHSELWLVVAESYLTPLKERTKEQSDMAYRGLCWAIYDASHEEVNLYDYIYKLGNIDPNDNWLPDRCSENFTPVCDEYRCLAACFLATMPEDIYEDMMEAQ